MMSSQFPHMRLRLRAQLWPPFLAAFLCTPNKVKGWCCHEYAPSSTTSQFCGKHECMTKQKAPFVEINRKILGSRPDTKPTVTLKRILQWGNNFICATWDSVICLCKRSPIKSNKCMKHLVFWLGMQPWYLLCFLNTSVQSLFISFYKEQGMSLGSGWVEFDQHNCEVCLMSSMRGCVKLKGSLSSFFVHTFISKYNVRPRCLSLYFSSWF